MPSPLHSPSYSSSLSSSSSSSSLSSLSSFSYSTLCAAAWSFSYSISFSFSYSCSSSWWSSEQFLLAYTFFALIPWLNWLVGVRDLNGLLFSFGSSSSWIVVSDDYKTVGLSVDCLSEFSPIFLPSVYSMINLICCSLLCPSFFPESLRSFLTVL